MTFSAGWIFWAIKTFSVSVKYTFGFLRHKTFFTPTFEEGVKNTFGLLWAILYLANTELDLFIYSAVDK